VSRAEAQGRGGRPQNGKDQEQKAVLDDLGPACGHVQAGLELNGTNGQVKSMPLAQRACLSVKSRQGGE